MGAVSFKHISEFFSFISYIFFFFAWFYSKQMKINVQWRLVTTATKSRALISRYQSLMKLQSRKSLNDLRERMRLSPFTYLVRTFKPLLLIHYFCEYFMQKSFVVWVPQSLSRFESNRQRSEKLTSPAANRKAWKSRHLLILDRRAVRCKTASEYWWGIVAMQKQPTPISSASET